MKKVYVTGSNGLVGSRFVKLSHKKYKLFTPEIDELDILDEKELKSFFKKEKPDVCINFAAFTDVNGAEKQIGDKKGLCWKVNVSGTRNLAKMCQKHGTFMIHISTDMVFSGKGPFSENNAPETDLSKITWYGHTKAEGERIVKDVLDGNSAIVRIIYPVRANFDEKLDYLRAPLAKYDEGALYPLFSDQQISVTYVDELCEALTIIIDKKKTGIFHVGSKDTTTPHEIVSYLIKKTRGEGKKIEKGSLDEFLKKAGNPGRYQKYGGLKIDKTQRELRMKFSTWREVVDKLVIQGLGK